VQKERACARALRARESPFVLPLSWQADQCCVRVIFVLLEVCNSSREREAEVVYCFCGCVCVQFPTSLVSLVDKERQWFKSTVGLGVKETHRDLAFCSHVVYKEGNDCMVVSDTWQVQSLSCFSSVSCVANRTTRRTVLVFVCVVCATITLGPDSRPLRFWVCLQDDRFKYSDLVLGDPKIRAYAGAPLLYRRDGKTYKLGTLCVIDASPREFNSEQISLLETMAKLVVAEIEVREKNMKGSQGGNVKVHLFPRRKAGDDIFPEKGRLPVKVDRETVESLFGVPQPDAARALGISLTSLKQVCRKLGVTRWPYQRTIISASSMGGMSSAASGSRASGGAASSSQHVVAPASAARATQTAQMLTGQISINSSTLEVMWLSTQMERAFEASPFPVVGQRLVHLLHPKGARRVWTFLNGLAVQGGGSSESAAAEAEEGVSCQMLMYRKNSPVEVGVEVLDCLVRPRIVASELAQKRMMLEIQLVSNAASPWLPMCMGGADIQTCLKKSGQFIIDDLASETDYPAICARSSKASGLQDLWAQWESRVTSLAAHLPAESGAAGGGMEERQHPSLECLKLLSQVDKRSGMRIIQNCTRLLIVPELHGNVIGLSAHVRFATPRDDIGVNPLGAIADWQSSEGLLLGLAGLPVMCNGQLQFRQSIGHFVPTAFWDIVAGSLHIQIRRLRTENGRMTVYQSEYSVVSEHDGRNVVLVTGTILGGNCTDPGGPDAAPFHYRLVLGQVGNMQLVPRS
jgi:hypothetical protein